MQRTVRGQLLKDVERDARGEPHAEARNACNDIEPVHPGRCAAWSQHSFTVTMVFVHSDEDTSQGARTHPRGDRRPY